jgi:cell cycle sensor histidine kinase DivJ
MYRKAPDTVAQTLDPWATMSQRHELRVIERSRLAGLFVAALLVPILLVLDAPTDWRLALIVATPTLPPILALIAARLKGVELALALQFAAGVGLATAGASAGFGLATPILLFALMVMDGLLVRRAGGVSEFARVMIPTSGFLAIASGALFGGPVATEVPVTTLVWLAIPYLAQLGAAIAAWRAIAERTLIETKSEFNALDRYVARAQKEAGMLVDRAGRVEEAMENARDHVDIERADLEGRGLIERMHLLDRPAFLRAVADAAADSRSSVLRLRLSVGQAAIASFRWFEGRVFPVGEGEKALLLLRDIHQDILQFEQDAARRAQADIERRRRATFLADLSHDVRTPLNAVIGFSELLGNATTQPREPARIGEYAGIINRAGRDLLEVVTMLIEMTRVENGAFEFSEEPMRPRTILDRLRETLAEAVDRPGLRFEVSGEADAKDWVVDPRAARQTLFGMATTLIDQAGDVDLAVHVSNDGVMIRFALSTMPIEGAAAGGGRRSATAGLSLEVAQALAALMGGEARVLEPAGESLRAEVRLPLAGRVDDRQAESAAEPIDIARFRTARAATPAREEAA